MTRTQAIARQVAARARYAAATLEWRQAYADLAALDELLGSPGFGPPPDIVMLRHAVACPAESGSVAADISAARQNMVIEEWMTNG